MTVVAAAVKNIPAIIWKILMVRSFTSHMSRSATAMFEPNHAVYARNPSLLLANHQGPSYTTWCSLNHGFSFCFMDFFSVFIIICLQFFSVLTCCKSNNLS